MKIHSLITTSAALADLCSRLAKSEFVCVDTEFMRENTFWPELCLIKIAGERINRRRFLAIGDLDQAQFGPICVLTHEFGVNADEFSLGQAGAQVSQRGGRGNQGMYLHGAFL